MTDTIIILVILFFLAKVVIFGPLLYWVFRDDVRLYLAAKKEPALTPACVYCQSKWTQLIEGGATRWEGEDLILTTTYQCQHCHLPFWHVERVPIAGASQ